MTIIGREKLKAFSEKYRDAADWISNWIVDVENANWKTPIDTKNRYPTVRFLPKSIAIFKVKGNSYRLKVQIAFKTNVVFVKSVNTHEEYSKQSK